MRSKWYTYGGIALVVFLVAYIVYMQIDHQERLQQGATERQAMEQLLRSREKQVEFYFTKVNELISANQELEMHMNLLNGGEMTKLNDPLVRDVLDSKEYQEIVAEYRKYYGLIDEYSIPEDETLGGLRYKVQDSLAYGYDLLPSYYGITNVLMCLHTEEFRELNSIFQEHFGDIIPTEEIFGTFEELNDIVNKSVEEGRNFLPEYYGYGGNR